MRRRACSGAGGVVKLGSAIGEVCCACADGVATASSATKGNRFTIFNFISQPILRCSVHSRASGNPATGYPLSRLRAVKHDLRYITIMADLASDPIAWRPVKAPSLAELEALAGD